MSDASGAVVDLKLYARRLGDKLTRKNATIIPMMAMAPRAPTTPPTTAPVLMPPDAVTSVEVGLSVAASRPSVEVMVGEITDVGKNCTGVVDAAMSVVPC